MHRDLGQVQSDLCSARGMHLEKESIFERVSISGVWFRAGPIGLATNRFRTSFDFWCVV